MELPLLQHPADVLIVVGGPGIRARMRMAPRTRKIRAILRWQEGDQGHLAHCRDLLQSRSRCRSCQCTYALNGARPLGELEEAHGQKQGAYPQPMGSNVWLESPTCRESERFACLRKLAVRVARGLLNRDSRLSKPLAD